MPVYNRNHHNQEYWDRLRDEFKNCEYQHGGAYRPLEGTVRSKEIDELRAGIRVREAIYTNWRDHPTMEPKKRGSFGGN